MNADYTVIKNGFIQKARTLKQLNGSAYFVHDYQVTDDDADANRGGKYFLLLKPGAVPISPIPNLVSKKFYKVDWNIVFDLQVRYKSYKESWDEFTLIRDAVLNLFVFTLDKSLPGVLNIWDVSITAPNMPGQKPPESTPVWLGQQMIAIIEQHIDLMK